MIERSFIFNLIADNEQNRLSQITIEKEIVRIQNQMQQDFFAPVETMENLNYLKNDIEESRSINAANKKILQTKIEILQMEIEIIIKNKKLRAPARLFEGRLPDKNGIEMVPLKRRPDHFSQLPYDILCCIANLLNVHQFIHLSITSKRIHSFFNQMILPFPYVSLSPNKVFNTSQYNLTLEKINERKKNSLC